MNKALNILIVEDVQTDFWLIEHHLKQHNLISRCLCVSTRRDLGSAVESSDWDLVLSDYNVPGLDFEETLALCRSHLPDIPLILVSGCVGEERAVELLKLGVWDVVLKGNLSRLVPAIERSLKDAAGLRARRAAEVAPLENEERYRALFENANNGIAVVDAQTGIVIDCNQALCRLLGREKEEIVGRPQSILYPPKGLAHGRSPSDGEQQESNGIALEDQLLSKGGVIVPVEGMVSRIRMNGREYLMKVFRDLTERIRAEEERETAIGFLRLLNESKGVEDLIHGVTDFLHRKCRCEAVGIRLKRGHDYPYYETRGFPEEFVRLESRLCATDNQGRPILDKEFNPILECMCGNVISGRFDPSKLFFTEKGSFWSNCTTELLAASTDADRQTRTRNRCNGEGYESVALIPLRLGDERLGLIQLNDSQKGRFTPEFIALWERLADYLAVALSKFIADEALRESESLYRSLFENMLNGFAYCRMHFDHQGAPSDFTYLAVNSAFESLTGLRGAVGKRVTEVIPGIRESDSKLFDIYGKVAKTGLPERFEMFVAALQMWFSVSVYCPKREHFVAVFDVITERKRLEEDLRSSELRYRSLVEVSSDWVWEVDAQGKYTYASPKVLEILGYAPEEVLGRTPFDLMPEEEAIRVGALFEEIASKRRPFSNLENVNLHRSGRKIVLETSGIPLLDKEGEFRGYRGMDRDVTGRKLSQDALVESEARYRTLFESSHIAIMTLSPTGWRFTSANASTLRMFGIKDEETFLTLGPLDLSPDRQPDGEPSVEKASRMIHLGMEEGSHFFEWIHRRAGGDLFPATVLITRLELGGQVALLATVRDMTAQKLAEAERERLSAAVEQAAEGILITDSEAKILYVNPAFTQITRHGREEIVGRNALTLKNGNHDDALNRQLWETVRGGEVWHGRIANRRRDGSQYTLETTISPVRDAAGVVVNYVGVSRDITHELNLEAQFQQAQKMEAIGTLAGGIAHDFNNILSVIIGNAELATRQTPELHPASYCLNQVIRAGYRARDLVAQILAFSRQNERVRKPIRVGMIVKEVLKFLRASLPSTIEIRPTLTAERDTILGDPTQIHQVLMNLCTNAHHAMLGKGGVLEVQMIDVQVAPGGSDEFSKCKPGSYLKLGVRDSGCGISKEVMSRIFDPYFTTKEKGVGTGLGLAVVDGIVRNLEGAVRVQSEPGKGSLFEVLLPLSAGKAVSEAKPYEALPRGNERILFVDDEENLADMAGRMLQHLGYEVEVRTSSTEALSAFRKEPERFDLVITDMTMPHMTGDRLSQEILATRPDIPIIICTGHSDQISDQKAEEIGVRALVKKPITMRGIAETIRKALA